MSLEYVRNRYGVPAHRGQRVEFEGRPAPITSGKGGYIRLRFDGEMRTHHAPFHPTWHIDYLDGIDYGKRYDERIKAFNRALRSAA